MADIASSNVTYTLQKKVIGESSYREFMWKVQFGNSSLTYPAGGIPLTKASLGCPNHILSVNMYDANDASGYVYKYDSENNKLRIYQAAPTGTNSKPTFTVTKGAITANTELGLSADAATATVNNNTIAATLALTTNSPVGIPTFTGTAAALAELSGTAIAAQTLYIEVKGW